MTLKFSRFFNALLAALFVSIVLPITSVSSANIAIVDGTPITEIEFNEFLKEVVAAGNEDTPQLRDMIKDRLIQMRVFVAEAKKRKIDQSSDYKRELRLTADNLLIKHLVEDEIKGKSISDVAIQKEYDRIKQEVAHQKEYQVRHILVKDDTEANKILKDLKKQKFEGLARKMSEDKASAENGGSLGWSVPSAFVPEFSAAMVKLKPGETTQTPVKTKFGYHIIHLDAERPVKIPPLVEIKERISDNLHQQALTVWQAKLKDEYKSKIILSGSK